MAPEYRAWIEYDNDRERSACLAKYEEFPGGMGYSKLREVIIPGRGLVIRVYRCRIEEPVEGMWKRDGCLCSYHLNEHPDIVEAVEFLLALGPESKSNPVPFPDEIEEVLLKILSEKVLVENHITE